MTATISARSDIQGVQYDAFLSYSHAADGQLAPALQNAVQRFATPWYRLRSLHPFRDQTGLSASPGLWAAIEAALSRAAWFVLFASPDAAASVWVEREVLWWLAHRDPHHLLIVVTEGTFAWDAERDDRSRARGSAVPEALAEALPEEPRWIDLRWARSADHVDRRDPRFREAAADWPPRCAGCPRTRSSGRTSVSTGVVGGWRWARSPHSPCWLLRWPLWPSSLPVDRRRLKARGRRRRP